MPPRTHDEIQADIAKCRDAVRNLSPETGDTAISTQWNAVRKLLDEVAASSDPKILALKEDINAVKSSLELLNTTNSRFRDNRKLHYQEAGQWARHFSTVRMTVITFTITTCAAIVALNEEWPPHEDVMIPIGVLWVIGVLVFWTFTFHTYRQIHRQQKKRPLLASDFGDDLKPKCLPTDWASLIIPGLSGAYIWLLNQTNLFVNDCWTLGLWSFVAVGILFPVVLREYLNRK